MATWSDRTKVQGHTVNWGTRYLLEAADGLLRSKRYGSEKEPPTLRNGSYIANSDSIHQGGGVFDLTAYNFENRLKVLASLGAVAWHRPKGWDGVPSTTPRMQAVVRGDGTRTAAAVQQEKLYDDGLNGLKNNKKDTGFRLPGNVKPLFVFPEDPRGKPGIFYVTQDRPTYEYPSPSSPLSKQLKKGNRVVVLAVVRVSDLYFAIDYEGYCVELGGFGLDKTKILSKTEVTPTPPPSAPIDLTNWKITLPSGKEVTQPALNEFKDDPWFVPSVDGIQFRANAGGGTTPNSHYPRSELREMANKGKTKADWSSTTDEHLMEVECKITHVPDKKKHIVCGQIHDAVDDVCMIRYEQPKLFVESPYAEDMELDANLPLNTRFKYSIHVKNGKVTITYIRDGKTVVRSFDKKGSGWYYKAGVYTQSNVSKGDEPTAYGEVVIYKLGVKHF